MELCLVEGATSVEGWILRNVMGMDDEQRLRTVMRLLGMIFDAEEFLQDAAIQVWRIIEREGWWRAEYASWTHFTQTCGLGESMANLIRQKETTDRLKRKFEAEATRAWGGNEGLREVLGDLIPERAGKIFLEKMKVLSRELNDMTAARDLLITKRNERIRDTKHDTGRELKLRDVEAALREVRVKRNRVNEPKRLEGPTEQAFIQVMIGSRYTSDGVVKNVINRSSVGSPSTSAENDEVSVVTESNPLSGVERENSCIVEPPRSSYELFKHRDREAKANKSCKCLDIQTSIDLISRIREKDSLESKAGLLKEMTRKQWSEICRDHIRTIAGVFKMKNNVTHEELIKRMMAIQGKGQEEMWDIPDLLSLFRKNGKPPEEGDELGPFRYAPVKTPDFKFDNEEVVWNRYAGQGAMETFLHDGNVVVTGLFNWIVKDEELMAMVDAEFEMYRHHLREQNGKSNLGWCRNMWHSLVQQAIRQDPAAYALHVAARGDGNWRLVSHLYYAKHADVGDSTGFTHIDINIPKLISNGRGSNLVQSAVSLDDEFKDGCTLVVKGFHRHIEEWWHKVEARREATDGFTHDVKNIYKPEDKNVYNDFTAVVCKKGDMRLTKAQLLHGSTRTCPRVRRVVFPWLMGVQGDHESLDMTEVSSWEEIHRAQRDMVPMKKEPTGAPLRFGIGSGRFAGSVEMHGISRLGDAILGLTKWDTRAVQKERDIVLGLDSDRAWSYVKQVRAELKRRWKVCFREMVEAESAEFGTNSYFKGSKGLSMIPSSNKR